MGLTEESPLHLTNGNFTTLTWAAFAVQNAKAPDVDKIIDVRDARSIAIRYDTTATANVSTDTDINVICSFDGVIWDSIAYTSEENIVDNVTGTFLVTPGVVAIKITADNNDGGNNSAPSVIVYVDNSRR